MGSFFHAINTVCAFHVRYGAGAGTVAYDTNALETVCSTLAPGAMSHTSSPAYMRHALGCLIFYLHNVLMLLLC